MDTSAIKDRRKLPTVDIDAELRKFEEQERKRLGLDSRTDQWIEDMANLTFTKSEKANITMLVSGLTMAHDYFVEGGLKGVGYNVQMLDAPDVAALQFGKEFGNRGQCNPTYFTVGNLVKFLCTLRDKHGMSAEEIVRKYVFLTAGACGPCRFGMYVTEYRKALRDAGFDGFRVVLFQQTGGLSQATGEESGLEMTPKFFWAIVKALIAGDVLNALGYRIRPYEVHAGDTDRALERCKKIVYRALEARTNVLAALAKCKPILAAVAVDRTVAKPKTSIIGEFWAMTTEGDGNYQLQRFLESEGAEADIQLVTAWLLYMLWEARRDTEERMNLRGTDKAKYGLGDVGPFDIVKKLVGVRAGEQVVRALFQTFAQVAGLYGYRLPDMVEIARVSHEYYNNDLRGGEGHMEVGKLIMNILHAKAHMTLSVKPFGCMPSAGVSDGVQTAITEKLPGAIFCPVETSGDGRVNFYSRVQMYLFKAKQAAALELDRACQEHGVTLEQVRAFVAKHPRFASSLHKPPHRYAGAAADLVAEVAPHITMSAGARVQRRAVEWAKRSSDGARKSPRAVVALLKNAAGAAPEIASRVKEDLTAYREMRRQKVRADRVAVRVDAAAE
ncbi:MAG TPA: 2-hydroxyglutaryl-CoA dehydratase [Polyangiaceae bacterium]|nr:2-hydroxyglutaryl-CoA dehydratase [Polyangiaceae bacterium]